MSGPMRKSEGFLGEKRGYGKIVSTIKGLKKRAELTSYYISQAGDAARGMADESPLDEGEPGSNAF